MKIFEIILLLVLSMSTSSANFVNESIKALEHFLVNFDTSLSVNAFVCWESDNALQLIRTLNKRNFMVAIERRLITNFPSHQHNNFIVLDLVCEVGKQIIKQLNAVDVCHEKIVLVNTVNEDEILEVLKPLPILLCSEIFYFTDLDDGILVKQAYKTAEDSPMQTEIFGKWNRVNDTFDDLRQVKITSRRRRDLRGIKLKASMVVTNDETLHHLNDYHDKHIDTITKVNYKLTNQLVEWLNATVSYSVVNSWGYKDNETGRWSGMIGELESKKADLGASPLFFTADRIDVIEYIACTSQTRSKFVFRAPKLSYTDNVFLLPFDAGVWSSLFALIIIASFVLYIASHVEWKSIVVSETHDASVLRPSYYDTFFLIYCAVCQQGSFKLPISFGSRLITMISFTALMFMYASYSANIVAILQSPSNKIKTLEDLYNSRLQMGVDDTVFNHYYFSHAEEKTRAKIYSEKIRTKEGGENFYSLEQGVTRVRDGLFAFHMEVGVGYKILLEVFQEDEKCGLQEIQYLQVIDPFYAIQKNSSYKELFKVGLLRLREFGLQDRENSRFYTKKPKCAGHGSKFVSVGLFDVEPAILIFLYGVAAAVVVFGFEKMFHYWQLKFN